MMSIKYSLFFILFCLSCGEVNNQKESEQLAVEPSLTDTITDPKTTEIWDPEPQEVLFSEGLNIPSDALVLFDGLQADAWSHQDGSSVQWTIDDGEMIVKPGTGPIVTKEEFGDIQLHLEWKSPEEPDKSGQDKGNSGVFFQEKYEVQILNSYRNRTYSNGQASSIYKQHIPLVNATLPTGQWNTYDIIFHAPRFDIEGKLNQEGTLTVLHNGVLVQDHVPILGTTEYIGKPKIIPHGDGRILLQDHSNDVSFRNIWLRKI